MSSPRQRLDTLLDRALDLPEGERVAFVDREAADAVERATLARLLAAAERDSELPNLPPRLWRDLAREEAPTLASGDRLGAYRIEDELGRGGMATVYRAQRADGLYEQRVALKILDRSAADSRAVARFERERQILASLEHPGIARLLDGGIADDGRPWFALEYVEGQRIDAYCDERQLDVAARLRLFAEVGRAVAAAHRQLVVHRDLKPANILVSTDGAPKLLDFGIAKLLETEATAEPAVELTHAAVPMTPAYASPEQAAGLPVTTASDVYQLGLLLYELLAGQRAFDVSRLTPGEPRERATTTEPTRPSATLGTATAHERALRRGCSSPRELRRALAGDLDTIVLTALRPETGRRYESAARLVDDVERYLAGRPILARPESTVYRLRKFAGRHRWAVTAVGACLLALVLLAVVSADRLRRERDTARREAAKSQQIARFLADLFEASDPFTAKQVANRSALELLDEGTRQVESGPALANQPEIRAALLDLLANVYGRLGESEKALRWSERALALRTETLGADHPDTLESRVQRVRLLRGRGRLDEARDDARLLLPIIARRLGPGDWHLAEAQTQLALAILEKGETEEAASLMRQAIAIEEAQQPVDAERLARRLGVQASVSSMAGDLELAVTQARRAVAMQATVDPTSPAIASRLGGIAGDLSNLGRVAEAQAALLDAERILLERAGPDHPLTLRNSIRLGALSVLLGEPGPALERLDACLPKAVEALGSKSQWIGYGRMHRAMALVDLGRRDEAFAEAVAARDDSVAALGPTAPLSIDANRRLAGIAKDVGRFTESRDLLQATITLAETHLPAGSSVLPTSLHELADVSLALGDVAGAEEAITRAMPLVRARWPDGHVDAVRALASRAEIAGRRGDARTAREALAEALALAARVEGVTPLLRERLDRLEATIGPSAG